MQVEFLKFVAATVMSIRVCLKLIYLWDGSYALPVKFDTRADDAALQFRDAIETFGG